MTVSNVIPPAISGAATQGSVLTSSTGSWTTDAPPLSYGYQWERCDAAGANCVDIAGAVGVQRALAAIDVGKTLRVRVTATETPAPPPLGGPVVITSGGTYVVNAESTVAGTPAVEIQTSAAVTITGYVRKLVAGDTAPIIRAAAGQAARLTVDHCTIEGALGGYCRAVQAEGYNSLAVSNCTIIYTGGIDVRDGLAGSTVLVTKTIMTNVQGSWPRALHPSDPHVLRQFCQLNGLANAVATVSWNQVINQYGVSRTEDVISMYGGTAGALIENNYVQGVFPTNYRDAYAADGIIVGDSGGNNNLVQLNQIVASGHVGIGIEGGTGNSALNNRIVSASYTDTGLILCDSAVGLVGAVTCTITGNYVGFMANSTHGSGDPLNPGTLSRADGYGGANFEGTNTFVGGNHSTTVTSADEAAEWTYWQNKLTANGITLGA